MRSSDWALDVTIEGMTNKATIEAGSGPIRLWTGLLGGAMAWLVHFLLVYVISEWRCVPPLPEVQVMGMTGTAWLLLAVSVVMLAAACGATLLAYWNDGSRADDAGTERNGAQPFMARTGMLTSGLFAFIILVESVPILFFTSHC